MDKKLAGAYRITVGTTSDHFAVFGTYTDGDSEGIYTCSYDAKRGEVRQVDVEDAGPNPSFLAFHPDGKHFYAVNEVENGAVTALSIDRETGAVTAQNQVVTGGGADPCYCAVDKTGSYLLVAHYTGGAVAVIPILDDGRVGEPTQIVKHEGAGPNEERQASAHPHCIRPGPQNRFVYVPDLGTDRVVIYEFDDDTGELKSAADPLSVPPGSGPRHIDFHPTDDRAYLLYELDSKLVELDQDPDTGALNAIDSASTLPADFEGNNLTADIHVHGSGRYVYASNRGHNSIASFTIGEGSGGLTPIDHTSTKGEWPRNFALSPNSDHLFVENMHTNDVVTFAVDSTDGTLDPTGARTEIPSPSCLRFLPNV
jgi:6-phosphogluconolactonase